MHPICGRWIIDILVIFTVSVEEYEVGRARVIVLSRETNVKGER